MTFDEGVRFARDHRLAAFHETSAKTGQAVAEAVSNSILKCELSRSIEKEKNPSRASFTIKRDGNARRSQLGAVRKTGGCC